MRVYGGIDSPTPPIFGIYYGATRVFAHPYIMGMWGLKRAPPPLQVVIFTLPLLFYPFYYYCNNIGAEGRVYHGDNIPRKCVLRSPPETYVQYIKASPGSNYTYT